MAELVLNQGPDAVPKARRLVSSVLRGSPPEVVADAELIVAELATNALLHGRPPVRLRLAEQDDRIRIEVSDSGRSVPVRVRHSTHAMTGRGLDLVEAIAADWGVSPSEDGKTVWAEVVEGGQTAPLELSSDVDIDALLAAWHDDELAAGGFTVRLGSVPTELLLDAKAHIDNIVREMTLVGQTATVGDVALAPEMSALIHSVTKDFADARAEIKRQALVAAARGEPFTELTLTMPLTAADAGERYLVALDQADRYARTARLLTLAPPRSHRLFREWYVRAIIAELRAAGRGETAPPPTPFAEVLTAEVDRMPALEESQLRLELLQSLAERLAGTPTAAQVGEATVAAVASYPGIETARIYVIHGRRLRSIAWLGHSKAPANYVEISLDDALPGAEVARTGIPLFARTMSEIYERFPALAHYGDSERSLQVMPLRANTGTIGILGLTFQRGALGDDSQLSFIEAIAQIAAEALSRADTRGEVQ